MATSNDDVLQFLDELDGSTGAAPTTTAPATSGGADDKVKTDLAGDEQSVMDFLDEITQSASASTTTAAAATPSAPSPVSSGNNKPGYDPSALPSRYLQQQQQQQQEQQKGAPVDSRSSWLGSLWSTASEAVKQTQTVVQSSVKATMESQTGKSIEERVKGFVNSENINKIGHDLKSLTLSSMTTVLDVIAPPIAEHEVVEIWLAHDMVGYVGVESIVYRAFSKVMEQTEGGDVVVRQGDGTHSDEVDPENRQLNVCDGYDQAVKLAKANLEHLIKTHYDPSKTARNPNTHATICPVFMAIQPCRVPRHTFSAKAVGNSELLAKAQETDMCITYVIVLQDPTHKLEFESTSQSLPAHWLLIPYEENEWVEDRMVDCIRLAVGVLAQDYVWTRMKGDEIQRQLADAEAQQQLQQQQQQQQQKAQQQEQQQAGQIVEPSTAATSPATVEAADKKQD